MVSRLLIILCLDRGPPWQSAERKHSEQWFPWKYRWTRAVLPTVPPPPQQGSYLAHSLFLGVNAMHCMAERLGKGCSFTRSHPGCPAVLPAVAGALPGCLHVSASDPKQPGPCAPVGSEPEGCKHCWDPRVLGKDCTLGRNESD